MAGPQRPPQSRILLASGSPAAQDLPPKPRMWDQKETFYQGEDLGWLAPNIHPPKIIRVPTSTQQKDAHDTHQTFKQIVFCQI